MNTHIVTVTNDCLWNLPELYSFLIENTHKKIRLVLNPESVCLQTIGLYDILDKFQFEQVKIYTKNSLEAHNNYDIVINNPFNFLQETPKIDFNLHTWNQTKIFMCLYGRPNANRLGILSYLNSRYKDISHLSCQGNVDDMNSRKLFELEKLFEFRKESLVEFANLVTAMPLKLSNKSNYSFVKYNYEDPATQFYQDIFIDIVSETIGAGNSFFVTEKTVRPMLLKKPFIIFGTKNFLIYLRQMGFKTFYEYWDEDYDGFEKKDRFLKILTIIDSIGKKSKSELCAMYQDMQHILDHNYNLLVSKKYIKQITLVND
jgi:hypothetical protein